MNYTTLQISSTLRSQRTQSNSGDKKYMVPHHSKTCLDCKSAFKQDFWNKIFFKLDGLSAIREGRKNVSK